MGKFFIDKDLLEQEELEAKEKGISVLQLRHYKKLRENRLLSIAKNKEKREKEKLKKKEREKKKKERQKEKKKQLLLEKKRLEREKKKQERELEKLNKSTVIQKKKRPVGRPKKRGPKRKRKKKVIPKPKQYATWNYKIVSVKNGKQNAFIGKYSTYEKAYNKLIELSTNNDVIFPSKTSYINQGEEIRETKYEYLLLEKKKDENDISLLRNEFGKLVEQRSNSEKWNIIDKRQYEVEETFGLWGYNNRSDRKTFMWIYDNVLIGQLESKYDIEQVLRYKNKIVIKNDNGNTDIVFCKTQSDAIRFYQKIEEFVKKTKNKQIFLIGDYSYHSDKRKKLEEELMEITGWSKKKIQLSSTSEHKKENIIDFV